ncbi:MAG: PadR family transcriptional regulator [Desulfurococcales archaeon]|nr:PadR family transcriptional regulator [Desulfurococcales archaeon]
MLDAVDSIPARMLKGLTVGSLWLYILALLASRPLYPYEARKLIKEKFGFEPPIVTLYTTFYKLERDGLITKEHGVYRISSKGMEALEQGIMLLRRLAGVLEEVSGVKTG